MYLPEGYRIYEHIKTRPTSAEKNSKAHAGGGHDRQDAYLYGHPGSLLLQEFISKREKSTLMTAPRRLQPILAAPMVTCVSIQLIRLMR
jgi:hypothetical protein